MLPDGSYVETMSEDALHELLVVFLGPVETFFGVEVGVVEGEVAVGDLGS